MTKKPSYEKMHKKVEELEQDVLELKRAKEALKTIEERYRLATSAGKVGVWDLNLETGEIHVDFELKSLSALEDQEIPKTAEGWLRTLHADDRQLARKEIQAIFKGLKSNYEAERRLVRKDGKSIWLLTKGHVFQEGDKPVRVLGTSTDITERKRAEVELRESEAKYKTLVLNIPGMVYRGYPDWSADILNGSEELCGYTKKELDAQEEKWLSIIHPDDKERVLLEGSRMPKRQEKRFQTYRIIHKDGGTRWVEDRKTFVFSEEGEFVGIDGIVMDITEQKHAERALKARIKEMESLSNLGQQVSAKLSINEMVQSALNEIVHSAGPDLALFYLREDSQLLLQGFHSSTIKFSRDQANVHRVGECLCGLAASEGKPVYSNNIQTDPRCTLKECKEAGLRSFAALPLRSGKESLGVLAIGSSMEGEFHQRTEFLEAIANEITIALQNALLYEQVQRYSIQLKQRLDEQERTAKALQESEDRYRSLVENIDLGITMMSSDYKVVMTNAAQGKMLKKPVCDLVGKYCYEEFEKRNAVCAHCPGAKAMATGRPAVAETVGTRDDGIRTPVRIQAFPVIAPEGSPVGFIEVVEDITERRRVEEASKMLEANYRAIFNAVNDALFIHEMETGKILDVNRKMCEMYGYSLEEVRRLNVEDLSSGEPPYTQEDALRWIRGAVEGDPQLFEWRAKDKHGRLFWVEVNLKRSVIGGRERLVAVVRDITERKQMEEEITKTQNLRTLGTLAGGIAHDFNNILTAIMANISLARIYGNVEEDISQILGEAESASLRAKGLTQQLLTFATGGTPIKKTFHVSKLLRETAQFALSGSNVNAEYSLPDDLWPVEADEVQIGQVIQNTVINAEQAMPEGGKIRIGAENVIVGEKEHVRLKQGKYVSIWIADQGCGIAENQLSKIFDPFFTTKEKGRGLGLTTSFSIVHRHEGYVHVDSKVGVGTTFQVSLPASEEKPLEEEKGRKKAFSGEGRILLIDDEEMIRKSGSETLKRLGYDVTLAKEGGEGIRVYKQALDAKRPFDAVIMDLTIPAGMGGKDAVREFLKIDPKAKVIVSSGYSDDPVISKYREYGFADVVPKPYGSETLGEILHKVLSGGPG